MASSITNTTLLQLAGGNRQSPVLGLNIASDGAWPPHPTLQRWQRLDEGLAAPKAWRCCGISTKPPGGGRNLYLLWFFLSEERFDLLLIIIVLFVIRFYYGRVKKPHTKVISDRAVAMQRVMDAVLHGYIWWTSGEVSIEKAERLEQKFQRNYRVYDGRLERIKSKKLELGNARFLMLYRGPGRGIFWWLLVTDGEHVAHKIERLKNATIPQERVRFDGFVLSKEMRKPNGEKPAKLSWTWKFSREKDGAWREAIRSAIRQKRDHDLMQIMNSLYASPGFYGARKQIGEMRSFVRAEWGRSRAKGDKLPPLPTELFYARRLKTTGLPLTQLVNEEASLLKLRTAVEQAGKMAENRGIPPG